MLLIEYVCEMVEDQKALMKEYEAKGKMVEVKIRIPMSPDLFVDELEAGLSILGMEKFASYKNTDKLSLLVMCRLYEMLDWYAEVDPDGASLAAESLIYRLEELDSDDDMFPTFEVEELSKHLKQLPANYKPEEPPAPETAVDPNPLFDCLPNSSEEADDSESLRR